MPKTNQRTKKTHITILGWLNIADGALTLQIGALAFMFLTGIGFASGDLEALPILAISRNGDRDVHVCIGDTQPAGRFWSVAGEELGQNIGHYRVVL